MKKYVIAVCIIVSLIILCLIGYYVYKSININENPETIRAKADEEIKQLDDSIVTMLNNFNNISYTNYQVTDSKIPSPQSEGEKTNSGSSGSSSSEGGGGKQGGGGEQSGGEKTQTEGSSNENQNKTIESSQVESIGILTNQNKKTDWNTLKQETELMYTTWPVILIDLTSLNINNNQLLQYTSTLDKIVENLENENKPEAMKNLANLYNLLNQYTSQYSQDAQLTNILRIRGYILNAYALSEEEKWDEMKENIIKAKNEYTRLLNNVQNTNNVSNINKGYIILNEMEKNINNKSKNIFYLNYKNVMQELEAIM